MKGLAMDQDDALSATIIDAIIRVHRELGPGFLESIYQNALLLELESRGLIVEREKEIVIIYEGQAVGLHRLDLLVEGCLIVEVKAVEKLTSAHYAQIRSYLKSSRLRAGILVNFSAVRADFRRVNLD